MLEPNEQLWINKYKGQDLKHVNTSQVHSHSEVVWLIRQLDFMISNMMASTLESRLRKKAGLSCMSIEQYVSTVRALNGAKNKRQLLQDLKGHFRNADRPELRMEAYIRVAEKFLSPQEHAEIWARAQEERPELWPEDNHG